jgi:hypothetical protein
MVTTAVTDAKPVCAILHRERSIGEVGKASPR